MFNFLCPFPPFSNKNHLKILNIPLIEVCSSAHKLGEVLTLNSQKLGQFPKCPELDGSPASKDSPLCQVITEVIPLDLVSKRCKT